MGFETFRSHTSSGEGEPEAEPVIRASLEEAFEGFCIRNCDGTIGLPEGVPQEKVIMYIDHHGRHQYTNDPRVIEEEKKWPLH